MVVHVWSGGLRNLGFFEFVEGRWGTGAIQDISVN